MTEEKTCRNFCSLRRINRSWYITQLQLKQKAINKGKFYPYILKTKKSADSTFQSQKNLEHGSFGISPTAGEGGLGRLRSSPLSPSPSPQVQRGELEHIAELEVLRNSD